MGEPKRKKDEAERRRRLMELVTWTLIVTHDVLRLLGDLLSR